jgi:hypothetical protein
MKEGMEFSKFTLCVLISILGEINTPEKLC